MMRRRPRGPSPSLPGPCSTCPPSRGYASPETCALRTTWIRRGIIGAFGKIDAGFEGTLTLGAYNATDDPVEIPIGERFCQMVFETLSSPSSKDYAQRSGNYQGQTGVTLNPLKK